MRNLLLQVFAGGLIFLTACAERGDASSPANRSSVTPSTTDPSTANDLLATFQVKGRESRALLKSLSSYTEISALPATHEIVTGLIAKATARLSSQLVSSNLVASVGTSRLQNVLEAATHYDSAGEVRRTPAGDLSALILLHTSDLEHGQLKKQLDVQPTGALRISRNGRWSVIDLGNREADQARFLGKLLRKADASLHSTNWFDLTTDLQKLGSNPFSSKGSISNQLHVVVAPQGDGLRSEIHLTSDRPYDLHLGTWNVPTNTIRDPLIGFTAVQGIGQWLERQPAFQSMGLGKAPNQAFFWGQPISAFSVSAAVPSDTPRAAIDSIVKNYLPTLNSKLAPLGGGTFEVYTNQSILAWRGLPIAIPFVRPAPEPDSKFLYGGLFPVINLGTNVPPPDLMAQVTGRTNLVYYDWEITSERVSQWRQISQLISIAQNKFSGDTNLLSERWLRSIEPKLGNCITEVTLPQPRELFLVRRSGIGFNSLELVALARWLDPAYVAPVGKRTKARATPSAPLAPR